MSPAQQQLALALVERQVRTMRDEYLDASARSMGLFEELGQAQAMLDELRVEVASAGRVPVAAEVPVPVAAEVL